MSEYTLEPGERPSVQGIRARVMEIRDRLGRPVDRGIVEAVVAAQELGFDTVNSCEVHSDRGYAYPVVDANAPVPEDVQEYQADIAAFAQFALAQQDGLV